MNNYSHYKVWWSTYPFPSFKDAISFHTWLGMWLLIHAGNKVNPYDIWPKILHNLSNVITVHQYIPNSAVSMAYRLNKETRKMIRCKNVSYLVAPDNDNLRCHLWRQRWHLDQWPKIWYHSRWSIYYSDVIMSAMASQLTSVSTVCSFVCSGANQRKHQSPALLAFVRGIHR